MGNPTDGGKAGKVICGARLRGKPGRTCQRSPAPGRTRCKLHGGATPQGIASPHFRGGKYSGVLPQRLLSTYAKASADRELVGLREELQLTDVRLQELVGTLGEQPGTRAWAQVQSAVENLREQIAAGPKERDEAIVELEALVAEAAREGAVWGEVYNVINLRRRLVDSEAKRLQRLHQMITVDQAMSMFAGIAHLIRSTVRDPAQLRTLQEGLQRILERYGDS